MYKRQQEATQSSLPLKGTVLISVNRKDKTEVVDVARSLSEDGFQIVATGNTYELIREAGIEAEKVNKLYEGRPNILDMITNGKIDLIIKDVYKRQSLSCCFLSYHITVLSILPELRAGIPYFSTTPL